VKLYRFSPIASETDFMETMRYLHQASHRLCKEITGGYLQVRGNIGIFCHYYDEFTYLTDLRENICGGVSGLQRQISYFKAAYNIP